IEQHTEYKEILCLNCILFVTYLSIFYTDFCYHFETETVKSWQDAEDHCTSEQGHLVSFHSEEELSFLTGQHPTGISLWMGGHDAVNEGGWEWTDGSPFRYVRWAEGNPDDYFGEDCLSMYINDGYWNDDVCEYNSKWIGLKRNSVEGGMFKDVCSISA
uniref:C-type lectin domain-containing protein n=1 Tax=Cynoglossus semilaevis TaxID=244447 RepID=A0A3P8UM96_CYNSE